jgi:hypothetical protein
MPCGFFYLLDNEATRPVLTQPLLHCMTPFCNDLHDLRLKCKLAFPSAGDFAGDGSTKTNIKMNTK